MKLYSELQNLDYKKCTTKEVVTILNNCGCYDEFLQYEKLSYFKNFVFYIVHAYSYESVMMDTATFSESLKIIEQTFSYQPPEDGDLKDEIDTTIAWYLDVQKDRNFELLIKGSILYKQMISACTSKAILTKKKGDEIENIDYETKYDIYKYCVELNKELTTIEETIEQSKGIIEGVSKANPKIKNKMKRIEDV